jgi:CHAT domain-containing protein
MSTNAYTMLDVFISSSIEEFEKSNNIMGMSGVAQVVCDINFALMNSTEDPWKQLLSKTYMPYTVVGDVMRVFCEAGMPERSLALSQRFKSPGFCQPNIQHIQETRPSNIYVASYLSFLQQLSQAVENLKGPITKDSSKYLDTVIASGEMLARARRKLHDQDRILHARLGGVIPLQDLIDALPAFDSVGIVDLFVTDKDTIIHIIIREGNKVRVFPCISTHFSMKHVLYLLKIWMNNRMVHEINHRQYEGLIEIGRVLHDRLLCSVARLLYEKGVTQIIFIPDMSTKYLPLHLSLICSKEIDIPISDMSTTDATFLGEAFPVEYAPCLQAVAVSMHQKRPPNVSTILSLADPLSDLPGARNTAEWLASNLPKTLKIISLIGNESTLANLFSSINNANIVVIGTHGHVNMEKPIESFLVFNDGHWTMRNILDGPALTNSPVIVLSACEVGAVTPSLNDIAALGVPGALISMGAACVLGSLWPVEDISMGYIVERFLTHLSNPGYRPAAALFRALHDVKKLTKKQALDRCYHLLKKMEQDKSADYNPSQYIMLYNLIKWIEDYDFPYPFKSPQFWGGIVMIGSGWHSPMFGIVAPPESIIDMTQNLFEVDTCIANEQYNEAKKILMNILAYAEGVFRIRSLDKLAWVVWESRRKGEEKEARQKAFSLLASAESLAKDNHDDQMLRNINATRKKIELWDGKENVET